MKTPLWPSRLKKLSAAAILAPSSAMLASGEVSLAQIVPDDTLGAESSLVNPLTPQVNRIDGGAIRGPSLFHSFVEFSIEEGQGAYFANPAGIEQIFSRVTGSSSSQIMGTLGVLGNANLFLLNPYGILFGPNAQLDIAGSFVASTADSFVFSDGSRFSAVNPEVPPLLTVNASAPVGLQFEREKPGVIVNSGSLEVGDNLTLIGGTVVSTGELLAPQGEIAVGTVEGVEVSQEISAAQLAPNGQMLRQEVKPLPSQHRAATTPTPSLPEIIIEWSVDSGLTVNSQGQVEEAESGSLIETGDIAIQRLNAESAVLSAVKDLTLVESILETTEDLRLLARDTVRMRDGATNPLVIAAGEKLLVEGREAVDIWALKHADSGLFSGGDLVLRSANPVSGDIHSWSGGDFRIERLDGNLGGWVSLHDPIIRASGDVSFEQYGGASLHIFAGGKVEVSGRILIDSPEIPARAIRETVLLSDGQTSIPIDGSARPTLDIRAGTLAFNPPGTVGSTGNFTPNPPNLGGTPTGADITIGSIANLGGTVLLTNQYQPNTALRGGTIRILGDIITGSNSGFVALDARGNVQLSNSIINASADSGNTEDVVLLANGEISLSNSRILNQVTELNTNGNGGDVLIKGSSLTIAYTDDFSGNTADGAILVRTQGQGNAGNLDIQIDGPIFFSDANIFVNTQGSGQGGNASIQSDRGGIFFQRSGITSGSTSSGDSGNIFIQARNGDVLFLENGVNAIASGTGNAGDLLIRSENGNISFNRAEISVQTEGVGNAGNVTIESNNGNIAFAQSEVRANTFSSGNGGNVTMRANQGSVSLLDTGVFAVTFDSGSGGSATLEATESVSLDGSTSRVSTASSSDKSAPVLGSSGNATLRARNIFVSNGARVDAGTQGQGDGGQILLQTTGGDIAFSNGATLSTVAQGTGNAGDSTIESNNGNIVFAQSEVLANTFSSGNGGNVTMRANQGSVSLVDTGVFAVTFDSGNGGSATLEATGSVSLDGSTSRVSTGSSRGRGAPVLGSSGNATLRARNISVSNGARVDAGTEGQGSGGQIALQTIGGDITFSNGATVSTVAQGTGNAGDTTIESNNGNISFVRSEALANTFSSGNGGNLTMRANQGSVSLVDTGVFAATFGSGNGGSATLEATESVSIDGSTSQVSAASSGFRGSSPILGNGGNVSLRARNVSVQNGARVDASTERQGNGGSIFVRATDSVSASNEASISASAFGSGNGGRVAIQSDGLVSVTERSRVTVSSTGSGDAGDLEVNSKSLLLNNQGQLTATAEQGNGGNIALRVEETLLMRRNSLISAQSNGSNSNDGNIRIDAGFLVAVPAENSDIIARAINRGDIQINAQGVFGFRVAEDLTLTPLSDITSTGTTTIDVLEVDPTQGLTSLPREPRNPDVAEGCEAGGGQQKTGYFEVGSGGTPSNPSDLLGGEPNPLVELDEVTKAEGRPQEAALANARTRLTPSCQ